MVSEAISLRKIAGLSQTHTPCLIKKRAPREPSHLGIFQDPDIQIQLCSIFHDVEHFVCLPCIPCPSGSLRIGMQIPCITFVQTAQTSPVYNSCWHASQCLDCVAINKFYHLPALSVSLCNSLAASRANCICSYTA